MKEIKYNAKQIDHLKVILGSLVIKQFYTQEEYRAVVDDIFYNWVKLYTKGERKNESKTNS